MQTKYVYLLWQHEESGPEELMATLDKGNVLAMFDRWHEACCAQNPQVTGDWLERSKQQNAEWRAALVEKLALPDQEEIYPLTKGWGGWHFQIKELDLS